MTSARRVYRPAVSRLTALVISAPGRLGNGAAFGSFIGFALAGSTVAGAWFALPVPLLLAVVAVGAAALAGRRLLLIVSLGVLTSALSASAWAGLERPWPPRVEGTATLLRDPERTAFGGSRADMRLHGRHVQVWASNGAGNRLANRSAGQRVAISGATRRVSGKAAPSIRRRHISAAVDATHVDLIDDGSALARTTNATRALLQNGASHLPDDQRTLLLGFVLGDDRDQSEELTTAFRQAGLSHLLAVSGQNVAFVLLLCRPLLTRLDLAKRLVVGVVVVLLFGTLTRWEPSVLRAVIMASAVMAAAFAGRPVTRWQVLGLTIAVSLLVDPFLVGSVGFLLSVGACVGMAAFGEWTSDRLIGPASVRRALGYSLAAQAGVAPVHLAVFGAMPLAAVGANLLAEPVAAFVMTYGMTAGLLAGFVGGTAAELLHIPTGLATAWVATVARTASDARLGVWGLPALATTVGVLLIAPRRVGATVAGDEHSPRLPGERRRPGAPVSSGAHASR